MNKIETTEAKHISEPTTEVIEKPPGQVPVVQGESATLLHVIERAATNPQIDIDKMERLLQMQERIVERQARIDFDTAMAAAQSEMEPVVRTKANTQTNSKYAPLEAIAKAITPIYTKHGFSFSSHTEPTEKEGYIRIVGVLSYRGYSRQYPIELPLDDRGLAGKVNKTIPHAIGSTLAYGRRYTKLMAFDIATEDDDGNAAGKTSELITDKQRDEVSVRIEEVGGDVALFCKHYKIESLVDLPMEKFGNAMATLDTKEERNRKEAESDD